MASDLQLPPFECLQREVEQLGQAMQLDQVISHTTQLKKKYYFIIKLGLNRVFNQDIIEIGNNNHIGSDCGSSSSSSI